MQYQKQISVVAKTNMGWVVPKTNIGRDPKNNIGSGENKYQ